ncbi:hypothetical protein ACOTDE_16265 [Achromobacter xylosoxidans]
MTTEPLNAKTRRPRAAPAVPPATETEGTPLMHMKKALAQLQAGRRTRDSMARASRCGPIERAAPLRAFVPGRENALVI